MTCADTCDLCGETLTSDRPYSISLYLGLDLVSIHDDCAQAEQAALADIGLHRNYCHHRNCRWAPDRPGMKGRPA